MASFIHPEFLSQDENNTIAKLWDGLYMAPGLKEMILNSEEVVKLDGIIRFYWQHYGDVPCLRWHNPHYSLLLAITMLTILLCNLMQIFLYLQTGVDG